MINPLENLPRDQFIYVALEALITDVEDLDGEMLGSLVIAALRVARLMENVFVPADPKAPPWMKGAQPKRRPRKANAEQRAAAQAANGIHPDS